MESMESILIIRDKDGSAVAYETPYLNEGEIRWRKSISPFVDGLKEVVYRGGDSLHLIFQEGHVILKRWEWANQNQVVFFIVNMADVGE